MANNNYDAVLDYLDGTESTEEELRKMISTFRVHELQHLLGFGNRCKLGKKNELYNRALDFVRTSKSLQVQQKVRELYRRRFPDYGQSTTCQLPDLQYAIPSSLSSSYCSRASSDYANPPINLTLGASNSSAATFSGYRSGGGGAVAAAANSVGGSATKLLDALSCVNVRLTNLPFYDVIATLIKPTMLRTLNPNSKFQENYLTFTLNQQQMQDISYQENAPLPRVEVQLRFCQYDTSCEQKDDFPSGAEVRLNERPVTLPNLIPTNKPGVEPKRPSRSVNITPYCRSSQPQRLNVYWSAHGDKSWVVAVFLVRRLSSALLLKRLQLKTPFSAEHSKRMIKSYLSDDNDIRTMSLRVSLSCPIGKMRMQVPCRLIQCQHLQCFDADLFLRMNEKKPTWMCPVCDKPTPFQDLVVDEYFTDVLAKAPPGVSDIELMENGDWVAVNEDDPENDASDSEGQLGDSAAAAAPNCQKTSKIDAPEPILIDADSPANPQRSPSVNHRTATPSRLNHHHSRKSSTVIRRPPVVNYRGTAACGSQPLASSAAVASASGAGNPEILIDLTGDSDDDSDYDYATTSSSSLRTTTAAALPPLSSTLPSSKSRHCDDVTAAAARPSPGVVLLDSPPALPPTSSAPPPPSSSAATITATSPPRMTSSPTPPDDPSAAVANGPNVLTQPFPTAPPNTVSELLKNAFRNAEFATLAAAAAAGSAATSGATAGSRRKRQYSATTSALDLRTGGGGVVDDGSVLYPVASSAAYAQCGAVAASPAYYGSRSFNDIFFCNTDLMGYGRGQPASVPAPSLLFADSQYYHNSTHRRHVGANDSGTAPPLAYRNPTSSAYRSGLPSANYTRATSTSHGEFYPYGSAISVPSSTTAAMTSSFYPAATAASMTSSSFYPAASSSSFDYVAPPLPFYVDRSAPTPVPPPTTSSASDPESRGGGDDGAAAAAVAFYHSLAPSYTGSGDAMFGGGGDVFWNGNQLSVEYAKFVNMYLRTTPNDNASPPPSPARYASRDQ